jgi:hypothetical protein
MSPSNRTRNLIICRCGCIAGVDVHITGFKLQPSATVGESSKGRLTTWLSKTGATQDLEHRCRVDGARELLHAARR